VVQPATIKPASGNKWTSDFMATSCIGALLPWPSHLTDAIERSRLSPASRCDLPRAWLHEMAILKMTFSAARDMISASERAECARAHIQSHVCIAIMGHGK
jgi:hypothetical protein